MRTAAAALSLTILFSTATYDLAWGADKPGPTTAAQAGAKPKMNPVKRAACAVGRCLLTGLNYMFYYMPSTQIQLAAGKAFVRDKPRLAKALRATGYATLIGERYLLTSLAFGGPVDFANTIGDSVMNPAFDHETIRIATLAGLNLAMLPKTREAIDTAHVNGKLKAIAEKHTTADYKVTGDDVAVFLDLESGLGDVKLRDLVAEGRKTKMPVGQVAWKKFIERNGQVSTQPPAEQPK